MIRMPTTLGDLGDFLRDRGSLGTAAEIGVAEGRFSATLLAWGFRHLTLVDLWKESPELRGDASNSQAWHDVNYRGMLEHIDPWSDRVTILRGYSHEQAVHVADQSLDFVYVDANHFYGGVMADLRAWWPKIRQGGVMAGHDYLSPDYEVRRAVDEFAACRGLSVHVIDADRIYDAGFILEKPQ